MADRPLDGQTDGPAADAPAAPAAPEAGTVAPDHTIADRPAGGPPSPVRVELRSTVWITVAVLGAAAVLAVVRNAGPALTQVAIGVVLALALDPLVVATGRRLGLTRARAIAVVGGAFAAGGVLVALFVGPPATRQASEFGRQLPATVAEFEDLPLVGPSLRRADLEQRVDEWVDSLPTRFDAETIQTAATRLLSNVVSFLVVIGVTVGALLDGPRLLSLVRSPLRNHPRHLARLDRAGQVMAITLGQYFGGSLTVAMLMGLVVLVIALSLSIPLAPLAALWAAMTGLIPQVGGFLGGGLLVMLALTQGPVTALVAAGLFIVYMNIENHVISPAIVGESVNLTPATTMLAAFVGGAIAGIPGTLVATPLVGAAKRLYLEFRTGRPTPHGPRRTPLSRVRALIHRLAHRTGEPPSRDAR